MHKLPRALSQGRYTGHASFLPVVTTHVKHFLPGKLIGDPALGCLLGVVIQTPPA